MKKKKKYTFTLDSYGCDGIMIRHEENLTCKTENIGNYVERMINYYRRIGVNIAVSNIKEKII